MDEYVGLPEAHPQPYHSYMRRNLFDHVDIRDSNIDIPNGNASNLNQESRYRRMPSRKDAMGGRDRAGGVPTAECQTSPPDFRKIVNITLRPLRINRATVSFSVSIPA